MNAHERHNTQAGKIVSEIVRPIMDSGGNDAEMMVQLESVVLGVLLVGEKLFSVSRRTSSERLESLTQAVHERLGAHPHD